MPKRKKSRKPPSERSGASRDSATLQWVVVALLVGITFGGVIGYYVASAAPGVNGSPLTDQYGRHPGDFHYNHNHR